ncbi:MAG TPA: DNRLRE domain-containing protein [Thermoplasmata archaeon]|nr:DNRLRE domain-containing protein [Thermoplasmata archaeon]
MDRVSARALAAGLLLLLSAVALLPRASADPWLADNPDGTSTAVWNFTNPADYALGGTQIAGGAVSLLPQTTWWNSTSQPDFAGPDGATNVTWTQAPGEVALSPSSGPLRSTVLQPGAAGEDTWLDRQNPALNHGGDATLIFDGRNPQSQPILRFDLSAIPANVVIDNASLNLYQSAGIGNNVNGRARLVTNSWVEGQATWTDRSTGVPWGAMGGDYNAHLVDQATLDNTAGWKTWNVTVLADLWYRNRVPNYGLLLEAPNPGADSDKTFYSSDYNVDPTRRPRLDVWYRALGVAGEYVSKVGGPGTTAAWQTISWNSTERSLVSDEFPGPALDPKWTWTNPPGAYDVATTTPDHLHVVSSTGVDFNGAVFSGNVLSNDVVGDFVATMKFSANPTANGQKAGLMVLVGPRDWYAVWKMNATGVVNWRVRSTADAVSANRVDIASGNPIPAWIRIQRTGPTFTAYTSPDGSAWTLRDTYTPTFEYPLNVRLALTFADGLSGTAHTVDVDYLRVSLGNDATVSVSTRIGDVTPVDGTWTAWSAAYATPSGSAMAGTSRYVEYRLSMAVTYPDHVPVVGDVNLSWFRYTPSGTVETNDLVPADLAAWGTLTTVHALNGQTIAYEYSLDSGGSWTPLSPPADLSAASVATGRIRFRATLSTADTLVTPTLSDIRLTYTHRLDHFYVTASPAATAGAPFTVTVTAKDGLNATITSWTGAVTLAARLMDGVTPGGGLLGTTSLTIPAGGTATLNTETYTSAETIRIHASSGPVTGLSAGVVVSPGPVTRIVVTPDDVTILPFDSQVFSAQAFDTYDNPVAGVPYSWAVLGGVGSLNASAGPSVNFTASPPPANGTLEATFGAITGSAQIHVVSGIPPSIAIASPVSGAHVTGIVPIAYTNSSNAVSVEFDYDAGTGWILIGTTGVLNGTFLWDASGLDFVGGSLRAIVTSDRADTATTVVSPIEVDNTPPAITILSVTDDQATTGTLTVGYATDADVVQVDFTYFDGVWNVAGSDLTVDGSWVWTPGAPINGVTLRALAVDEVGLQGADERQGVGRYVVGSNPPAIAAIPDLHVRVGATYTLNLTFYVSDPDTPLSALSVAVSDVANVTANAGAYPSLDVTYGAAGTYLVTLWVSDGADTAWTIVRVIASVQNPPALVAALPAVAFDEDAVALDALGAPATAFFTDLDGDPLAFTVLDGGNVLSRVNANDTVDLWATSDWSGSRVLRLRATDPSGGFAEAAFPVTVRPVNDAPLLATGFPAVAFDEDTVALDVFVGNATLHFSDVDGDALTLSVLGGANVSSRINPSGTLDLWAPANWSGSETLRVRAMDPSGLFAEGLFLVTVRPVNDAPIVISPIATVTFDEDTVALNVLTGAASSHFTDRDGDALTFTLLGSVQVQARVNANLTLDLWAAPDWFGSENVRLRATDPSGGYAEAAFLVAVRPVNDAPVLAPIPDLRVDEGATVTLDLTPYITDIDTNLSQIVATTDNPAVTANGLVLTLAFPAGPSEAGFTVTISDGAATASRPVRVVFQPPWWKAPYVLAVPPIGVLLVVGMFAQRARWRPAKAFLVDERKRLIREFTLDPGCEVTYDQALQAGAYDAVEKPVKVSKYHARTVRGDALAVMLLAYGPVSAEQIEFAREMLVNIQNTFDDAVKERLEAARAVEENLDATTQNLESERQALAARSKAFAGAMDAATLALSKTATESAAVHAKVADVDAREARLGEELRELETFRGELETRHAAADAKAKELAAREAGITSLEASLRNNEDRLSRDRAEFDAKSRELESDRTEVGQYRKEIEEESARQMAESTKLEEKGKHLEDWEARLKEHEALVSRREAEIEPLRISLDARVQEVSGRETAVAERARELERREFQVGPREAELSDRETTISQREMQVQEQSEALAAKSLEMAKSRKDLEEREKALAGERDLLEKARADLDPQVRAFEERARRFESDSKGQRDGLEARAKTVHEEESRLDLARKEFEAMREEKSLWITRKEYELAEVEAGLKDREAQVQQQSDLLAAKASELAAGSKSLQERGENLERDREVLENARTTLEHERGEFDSRAARFEEDSKRRKEDLDAQAKALGDDQLRNAAAKQEFEALREERGQWIASKEIEIESRDQSLQQKETAVRTQAEENARHLADLAAREEALEIESDKAEKARAELAARRDETERLAKATEAKAAALREEETRKAEEFRSWQATMESQQALLRQQREAFEKEVADHKESWAMRLLQVEQREVDLEERETKLHGDLERLAQSGAEMTRREAAVQEAARAAEALRSAAEAEKKANAEHAFDIERRDRVIREEAAKLTDDFARRGAALKTAEAEFESRRAHADREIAVRARATDERIAELDRTARSLDARALELKEREGSLAALQANLTGLEERLTREEMDLDATAKNLEAKEVQLAQADRRNAEGTERLRTETEAMRQSLASKEAELRSERERLERESNALQDRLGAKARELSEREKALAAKESEIARGAQKFDVDRAAWSEKYAREMKQLEATQQAVAEQTQRSERLVEESQRRVVVASEAEKSAKRQADETRALQVQLEERRLGAEKAERAAEVQMSQLNDASRRLGAREIELQTLANDLAAREAKLAAMAQEASRAAEELRARRASLDQEGTRLAKSGADLEARRAELDARTTALESKAADLAQREQVLTTELQRAENLMDDLQGKETQLKARERSHTEAQTDLTRRESVLSTKEAELRKALEDLARSRQETERRVAETEADRAAAAKAREEALAVKAQADTDKAQSETMQQEVSKNMKFLQKKAVDVLEKEEKLRAREAKVAERETAVETRDEILRDKEKVLELEREDLVAKAERGQAEAAKMKARLTEAEKGSASSAEMEEWRRDIDNRVKIVQRKAMELLDREEKLRKKEEELRALADRLGVQT